MPTHKSYQAYLIQLLEDPVEAAHLDAVLEDSDFEHFLVALEHVAEAHRGVVAPSGQLDTSRNICDRLIAKGEVPGFPLIAKLLNSLELKRSVTVQGKQAA